MEDEGAQLEEKKEDDMHGGEDRHWRRPIEREIEKGYGDRAGKSK